MPLFLGANRLDGWPEAVDEPPTFDGEFNTGGGNNMRRFCMNRHKGFVNCLFLDFSARKVGLKELWRLNWHRQWNKDIALARHARLARVDEPVQRRVIQVRLRSGPIRG